MNKKYKQILREFKTQFREKFEKWKFEKITLVIADKDWERMREWYSVSRYPPSFYYYNSPEDVSKRLKEDRQREKEEWEQLWKKIEELD